MKTRGLLQCAMTSCTILIFAGSVLASLTLADDAITIHEEDDLRPRSLRRRAIDGSRGKKYFDPREDGFFDDYGYEKGQYRPEKETNAEYASDLRETTNGEPGVDYPAYTKIPRTSFSCARRPTGYYADSETGCQVFHICDSGVMSSFLCPIGSLFSQRVLTCEWWDKVICDHAPQAGFVLAEDDSSSNNNVVAESFVDNSKHRQHQAQYRPNDNQLLSSDDQLKSQARNSFSKTHQQQQQQQRVNFAAVTAATDSPIVRIKIIDPTARPSPSTQYRAAQNSQSYQQGAATYHAAQDHDVLEGKESIGLARSQSERNLEKQERSSRKPSPTSPSVSATNYESFQKSTTQAQSPARFSSHYRNEDYDQYFSKDTTIKAAVTFEPLKTSAISSRNRFEATTAIPRSTYYDNRQHQEVIGFSVDKTTIAPRSRHQSRLRSNFVSSNSDQSSQGNTYSTVSRSDFTATTPTPFFSRTSKKLNLAESTQTSYPFPEYDIYENVPRQSHHHQRPSGPARPSGFRAITVLPKTSSTDFTTESSPIAVTSPSTTHYHQRDAFSNQIVTTAKPTPVHDQLNNLRDDIRKSADASTNLNTPFKVTWRLINNSTANKIIQKDKEYPISAEDPDSESPSSSSNDNKFKDVVKNIENVFSKVPDMGRLSRYQSQWNLPAAGGNIQTYQEYRNLDVPVKFQESERISKNEKQERQNFPTTTTIQANFDAQHSSRAVDQQNKYDSFGTKFSSIDDRFVTRSNQEYQNQVDKQTTAQSINIGLTSKSSNVAQTTPSQPSGNNHFPRPFSILSSDASKPNFHNADYQNQVSHNNQYYSNAFNTDFAQLKARGNTLNFNNNQNQYFDNTQINSNGPSHNRELGSSSNQRNLKVDNPTVILLYPNNHQTSYQSSSRSTKNPVETTEPSRFPVYNPNAQTPSHSQQAELHDKDKYNINSTESTLRVDTEIIPSLSFDFSNEQGKKDYLEALNKGIITTSGQVYHSTTRSPEYSSTTVESQK